MKIIENNLFVRVERWEDPGDYPNALAAHALKSYYYCEYDGVFTFQCETDEDRKDLETVEDWINDWVYDQCDITPHCRYQCICEVEGDICKVSISEAEFEAYDPD